MPAMKNFDPETGAMPDENYAREIMQLFTIGLVELEQNGTPKLQNGEQIETYTSADIGELAKVFTGLDWDRWFSRKSFIIYKCRKGCPDPW